jgi:hypothetical protein
MGPFDGDRHSRRAVAPLAMAAHAPQVAAAQSIRSVSLVPLDRQSLF